VARHKVCLVAKGFTQIEGINFNETFSFIAWMESIWIVLVVTTIEDLEVHQMDVKFLSLWMETFKRTYMFHNLKALWSKVMKIWCISFKKNCTIWSNLFMNVTTRLIHNSYFKILIGVLPTIMFILKEFKKVFMWS
jgi:hypothetical protein